MGAVQPGQEREDAAALLQRLPLLLPGRVSMSIERHTWHVSHLGSRETQPSCAFLELTAPSVAFRLSPAHLSQLYAFIAAVSASFPPPLPPARRSLRPSAETAVKEEEEEAVRKGGAAGASKPAQDVGGDSGRHGRPAATRDTLPSATAQTASVPKAMRTSVDDLWEFGLFRPLDRRAAGPAP